MRFTECEMPTIGPAWDPGWSRPLSAWAGFFGAIPYGFGLWLVPLMIGGMVNGQVEVTHYLTVLLCFLPLLPFVVAFARVEPEERTRALSVIWAGMGVGIVSIVLLCFAGVVLFPAGALGLTFGLIALLPCWWRGDAAGRALALLGPAPAIVFLMFRTTDEFLGVIQVRLDQAATSYPFPTNRQVLYAVAAVLTVFYATLLYWALLRKIEPIIKTLKAARSPATIALAGGMAGGAVAGLMTGVLCLGIGAFTHLNLYDYVISSTLAGAISGAIGRTVVTMSRNAGIWDKLAAIATYLTLGLVQLALWNWWDYSSFVLIGGMSGLYGGIIVGSQISPIKPTAKKLVAEL